MSQGPIIKPGRWREPKPVEPESPAQATPPPPPEPGIQQESSKESSSSLILLSTIGVVLGLALVMFIYFLLDDPRQQATNPIKEVNSIALDEPAADMKINSNDKLRTDIDIENLSKLWFNLSLASDQIAVLRRNIAVAEADKQSQTYQALMFALETKLKEQTIAKQSVAQQLQQIYAAYPENPEQIKQYFEDAINSASAKYKPDLVMWLEQSRDSMNSSKTPTPSLDFFMGITHQLFPSAE